MKLSANVTQGVDRAPNRSLFAALGYTKEETAGWRCLFLQ